MTDFVFPPPPRPAAPVVGETALFPVRRILCVGRNYSAHRREMGGDDRDPPFFFAKPADAVTVGGASVPYPSGTRDLQHEVELVAALGDGGADIPADRALAKVFGWTVGVDLTRRDLQSAAKSKGQPWSAAKGFDHAAPIGAIRRAGGAAPAGRIRLSVNGEIRQDARLTDMIWSVAEVIAQASRLWTLAAGDLIFTGTPEGVGALARGDRVEAAADDVGELVFTIT